jgi:hypothetical protein
MNEGELVTQHLSRPRPLFATWRFESTGVARLVGVIEPGHSIMILSKTIVNPFTKLNRLRKVMTYLGVGYMWEHELAMLPGEDVEYHDEAGNVV